MRKYWWVLALTISLTVCLGAWYVATSPPTYISTAKLTVSVDSKVSVGGANQGNNPYAQQLDDFLRTQMEILKSGDVARLTADRLAAQYPGQPSSPVKLEIVTKPAILVLNATGRNPAYTQHWLEATVTSYLQKRREMVVKVADQSSEKVRAEINRVKEALREDADAIIKFQRDHNIVLQKEGTRGEDELTTLRSKLSSLRSEYESLRLTTPEAFDRGSAPRMQTGGGSSANTAQQQSALENSSAGAEYRQVQQQIVKLKAERDDFATVMRPKHPKMQSLTQAIEQQEKLKANLLYQIGELIRNRRETVDSLIKSTEEQIKIAEQKALSTDLLEVEFKALTDKEARDQKTYDDLQIALRNLSLGTNVGSDTVTVMEEASAPEPTPSVWIKMMALALIVGIGSGVGILLLIDRMDDRMGSINDFQLQFSEHVIGQIPRDDSKDAAELLRPDDDRHQLVESFRNLRSTLLYMPLEGKRPKTLLITSAIPNEGKSTVSTNLALVMAFAGMKTLLIDADLRRGAIHKAFGLKRGPGLTDVLGPNGVNWKLAIRETGVENLHLLPRGRNVPQPSEYLLNRKTDELIKELYPLYDYIIIDSSPILAADDTSSLAPKIDATLFICRLSFTSAKMTRKSLEVLYKRQANIPGLILNQVDTSSPEFVYYQYSEYYHAMPPDGQAEDDDDDDDDKPKKVSKRQSSPAPSSSARQG
jgi:succinoglycan biosynthesis transport protein ExoP